LSRSALYEHKNLFEVVFRGAGRFLEGLPVGRRFGNLAPHAQPNNNNKKIKQVENGRKKFEPKTASSWFCQW
jgi:hypothetical protein